MDKQELINKVSTLIKTPATKDGTNLDDWIIEGDDMTPEEIAQEWDDLPAIETEQKKSRFM